MASVLGTTRFPKVLIHIKNVISGSHDAKMQLAIQFGERFRIED